MKVTYLALAAALAATATGAFAETGVHITQIDNVANVYGRAGVPNVKIAGPVVSRPDEAVPVGPNTQAGPTAIAIGTGNADVNNVLGRS
ncbi:MAG TPA: hypothetical protein VKD04_04410 [Burkholderiales bacterium]|nr:hypothetical protein [Burkholderiales bacterium]